MDKKTFFWGLVTGVALTLVALYIIKLVSQITVDPIKYLEHPVSYENKSITSFKVFQVLGNAALAREASDRVGDDTMFYGNTVVILGENFYSDQVVTINKPQRVGNYSYTNNFGMPMTVPVVTGEVGQ